MNVRQLYRECERLYYEIDRKRPETIRKYQMKVAELEKQREIEQAQQWIADVYHCSDCWGQTMDEDEMRIMLVESEKEKDPDDYSPAPDLSAECTAYWNELCELYPN